jgi:hypothetical protein
VKRGKPLRLAPVSQLKLDRLAEFYHVDAETVAESAIALLEITVYPASGRTREHPRAPRRVKVTPVRIGAILKDVFNA